MAVNSDNPAARNAGQLDQARQEIAMLNEQIRINDARWERIPPHQRPFFTPVERMAINKLRAARGWNLAQTAQAFHVEPATIAKWLRLVDNQGASALVQLPKEPVNKFPKFVRHVVQQLKTLCPTLGKKKIAQLLAHAGLQIGTSSVGRFLKASPSLPTQPTTNNPEPALRHVTSKYPNHVWNIDLTTIPTTGFWTSWFPFALPQCWPFCWWICLVIDHFSRRIMGFAVFNSQPSSEDICLLLNRLIRRSKAKPKHLITDRGTQFDCERFKTWCKRKKIKNRYGAVGKYGGIAIIERFILSLKSEYLRRILLPLRLPDVRREISCYLAWYNEHRPHETLQHRTPMEVYTGESSNLQVSSFSPHPFPHIPLSLRLRFLDDTRLLPVVELMPAA